MINILKRSFIYLKEHRLQLIYGIVLSLLNTGFGIMSSYSLKLLIDDVLLKNNIKWLWPLQFTYMFVVFFGAIFMVLSAKVFNTVASKCILKIKEKLFCHYLRMNYEDAKRIEKSEVTNALTYSVDSLSDIFSSGIPMMISSAISIMLIVGVMFYIDYRLTIISLFVYPLLVLVNNFLQKIISKEQANYLSKRQLLLKEIDDAVKCRDEIWTYNLLKAATTKFIKRSSDLEKSRIKLTVIGEFRSQASWVLIMVPYQAILYGIGGMWMIKTGDPTLGILMAFSNFTNFLINPVMRLVNTSSAISQAGVSYDRIDKFTDIELQQNRFDYSEDKLAYADGLKFKYKESDKYILKDFKLNIDLNKITILWGQSGSGKSTLLKIVSGLLESEGIKIHDKLNENDFIRSDNFAYFPQSPNTFDGSVRDLFKMINPDIQEKEMIDILNEVGLYNHFKNKDGLDTIVKNSESTFSGGEHRRFCLALFLGYDADIMLFDEPTASLDKNSADMIINIISDLKNKNKTCVISTHDVALKDIGDEIIEVSK